jgi:hypothetical protein
MTKTLAQYDIYLTRAMAAFAALCALSVFLYGVFLLMAVAHAAGISQAQEDARGLSSKIGALDAKYLAETTSLTQESAAALGYVKPSTVAIVYTQTPTLTFNR